jgi:hypothetical protein
MPTGLRCGKGIALAGDNVSDRGDCRACAWKRARRATAKRQQPSPGEAKGRDRGAAYARAARRRR